MIIDWQAVFSGVRAPRVPGRFPRLGTGRVPEVPA
jgi:hypothetical protein